MSKRESLTIEGASAMGDEFAPNKQFESNAPAAPASIDAGAGVVESASMEAASTGVVTVEAPRRRRGVGMLAALVLLVGFVTFLAIGLQRQNASGQRAAGMAPDFEFTTFDGETVRLEDLRGQGVVVNFWASWCEPCRTEAELLEAAWLREKDNGIVFLGIDYLDQEHAARDYLAEYNITYPNGPDLRSDIARRYRIKGVPETFFISPDGQIVDTMVGPFFNESDLINRIDEIRPTD